VYFLRFSVCQEYWSSVNGFFEFSQSLREVIKVMVLWFPFHYPYYYLFIYFCGSTVLIRTRASSHMKFLELFRHTVGLLGRVISPSQGLYLHRTTQHRKTRDKHPCLERDSSPRSQQPTGQDPRLRPHGHCDRHVNVDGRIILKFVLKK
jgi:hypothetical protein